MPHYLIILLTTLCYCNIGYTQKIIPLKEDRETILMPHTAVVKGGFELRTNHNVKFLYTKNWKSKQDSLIWQIAVPNGLSGDYLVYALVKGENSELTVSLDNDKLLRYELDNPSFSKLKIGTLSLSEGNHTLKLYSERPNDSFIHSLELITPKIKVKQERKVKSLRSDTKWMRKAGYGIMFHWTADCYPVKGDRKNYEEAVNELNTDSLAKYVHDMGAGFLLFTTSHAHYHIPAPIKSVDEVHHGHTTKRDLIDDLYHSLNVYGIKLILYYHLGHSTYADPKGWWQHSGYDFEEPDVFFTHWKKIVSEMGTRYGKKIAGFSFDDGIAYYPLNPSFYELTKAAKSGYADRIVSYNSWLCPKVTDFQDFVFGETGFNSLKSHISIVDGEGIRTDRKQKDLQSHVLTYLENSWVHNKKNKAIDYPRFDYKKFKDYAINAIQHGIVPTINLNITQEGIIGDSSFSYMKQFKKDYESIKKKENNLKVER